MSILSSESFKYDRDRLFITELATKYAGCYFYPHESLVTRNPDVRFRLVATCQDYYFVFERVNSELTPNYHSPHGFDEIPDEKRICFPGWNPPSNRKLHNFYYANPSYITFQGPAKELTAKEKRTMAFNADAQKLSAFLFFEKYKDKPVIYKTNKYNNLKGRKFRVKLVAQDLVGGGEKLVVKFLDNPNLSSLRLKDLVTQQTLAFDLTEETGYWLVDKKEIIGLAP